MGYPTGPGNWGHITRQAVGRGRTETSELHRTTERITLPDGRIAERVEEHWSRGKGGPQVQASKTSWNVADSWNLLMAALIGSAGFVLHGALGGHWLVWVTLCWLAWALVHAEG